MRHFSVVSQALDFQRCFPLKSLVQHGPFPGHDRGVPVCSAHRLSFGGRRPVLPRLPPSIACVGRPGSRCAGAFPGRAPRRVLPEPAPPSDSAPLRLCARWGSRLGTSSPRSSRLRRTCACGPSLHRRSSIKGRRRGRLLAPAGPCAPASRTNSRVATALRVCGVCPARTFGRSPHGTECIKRDTRGWGPTGQEPHPSRAVEADIRRLQLREQLHGRVRSLWTFALPPFK